MRRVYIGVRKERDLDFAALIFFKKIRIVTWKRASRFSISFFIIYSNFDYFNNFLLIFWVLGILLYWQLTKFE